MHTACDLIFQYHLPPHPGVGYKRRSNCAVSTNMSSAKRRHLKGGQIHKAEGLFPTSPLISRPFRQRCACIDLEVSWSAKAMSYLRTA